MRIEIECNCCDFSVIADWPEDVTGRLRSTVGIDWQVEDEGLNSLRLHHSSTRPSIGKREGLASGHDKFIFRKIGEKNINNRVISVSGDSATMIKKYHSNQ